MSEPMDPTCQHDDAGQPCGRHLERGECSVHGRAAWPNPDACCSRNAFEDDAHSPTCPNANDYTRAFHGRAATPPLDVERLRRDLWDSRRHETNIDGSACWCVIEPMPPIDHEEMCLRLRALRARLAQQDGTGE